MKNYLVGQVIETEKNGPFEVVSYEDCRNVTIRFLNTGYTRVTTTHLIRGGRIKDKLKPSVCGVGFIGDGPHKPSYKGKTSREYEVWRSMLSRCYSGRDIFIKPYANVTVDKRWHNFQNFYDDLVTLPGYEEWLVDKKMQIDKDLLQPNVIDKVYSKDTCMFIHQIVNLLIAGNGSGRCLTGVSPNGANFTAKCSNPFTKREDYLGTYSTQEEAHKAYTNRKMEIAEELSNSERQEEQRVGEALIKYYHTLTKGIRLCESN